jgi:hypothetical protein
MTDDPNAARQAAAEELRDNLRFMDAFGIQVLKPLCSPTKEDRRPAPPGGECPGSRLRCRGCAGLRRRPGW